MIPGIGEPLSEGKGAREYEAGPTQDQVQISMDDRERVFDRSLLPESDSSLFQDQAQMVFNEEVIHCEWNGVTERDPSIGQAQTPMSFQQRQPILDGNADREDDTSLLQNRTQIRLDEGSPMFEPDYTNNNKFSFPGYAPEDTSQSSSILGVIARFLF